MAFILKRKLHLKLSAIIFFRRELYGTFLESVRILFGCCYGGIKRQDKRPIVGVHWSTGLRDNLSCCAKSIPMLPAQPADALRASSRVPSPLGDEPKERLRGRLKLSPILKIRS